MCGQGDLWASSAPTPTPPGPASLQPAPRTPPVMHPTSSPREPTAARGSASRGKTVPSWFSSIHYSLPLSGPGAVWPGAAPPPLWASFSLCVTGGSADPSQLQRALRLLTGGRSLIRGRQPGRGGCGGDSPHLHLLSRASGGAAPEASGFSPTLSQLVSWGLCSVRGGKCPHSGSP